MQRGDLDRFDLPDTPGVYRFLDSEGTVLYVGKATSLHDRVRSYFAKDLAEARSPAIVAMVERAVSLSWEQTETVLEALILEANLIKELQPQYNILDRDNKSFNYLVITKETYPRILTVRGRELFQSWKESDIKYLFGPFPQGGSLKEALKLVRKIFPYRDACTPESGRPCFNAQISLCPGVCSGKTDASGYREIVRNIVELFSGKMGSLRRRLEREMKQAANDELFERATELRRQVHALTHVRDVSLIKNEYRYHAGGALRIEAYDVAHTAGSETVGVMVVVEGGVAQKEEYRMFKIKAATNDDVAALSEILERRLTHPEWRAPRIVVVDGSTAQMRAAARVLKRAGVSVPLVGVVKDERHKPLRLAGDETITRAHEKDILLANSEAHRFAITFHRNRLRKRLRTTR
jgi:excinuclease ABC subunit C